MCERLWDADSGVQPLEAYKSRQALAEQFSAIHIVLGKLYHRAKVSVDQTKEGFCPGGLMSYTRLQTVIASPVHVIEHYFISFHIIFICSEKHIIKLT